MIDAHNVYFRLFYCFEAGESRDKIEKELKEVIGISNIIEEEDVINILKNNNMNNDVIIAFMHPLKHYGHSFSDMINDRVDGYYQLSDDNRNNMTLNFDGDLIIIKIVLDRYHTDITSQKLSKLLTSIPMHGWRTKEEL